MGTGKPLTQGGLAWGFGQRI